MARLRFAPAWQPSLLRSAPKAKAGGKGIRTPETNPCGRELDFIGKIDSNESD